MSFTNWVVVMRAKESKNHVRSMGKGSEEEANKLASEWRLELLHSGKDRWYEVVVKPPQEQEEGNLEIGSIPEEEPQTVDVVIIVEGGMERKGGEKGSEYVMNPPEFLIETTTKEEFEKHGRDWQNEKMWSRPVVAIVGNAQLDEVLKAGEYDVDLVEELSMTFGEQTDAIRDFLAENVPPFNKFARFTVRWKPEDITWTDTAKQAFSIYKHQYVKEELSMRPVRDLELLLLVKDVVKPVRGKMTLDEYKTALISSIVEASQTAQIASDDVAERIKAKIAAAQRELQELKK